MLNVGLNAGILDTRTFSMFVLHAIILTFMTTPLTILIYPSRFYVHESQQTKELEDGTAAGSSQKSDTTRTRLSVVLDRIEQLPAIMTLTQMLQPPYSTVRRSKDISSSIHDDKASIDSLPPGIAPASIAATSPATTPRLSVNALRLIELTERTSAVLKSQTAETLIHSDPALSILRTFGFLNHINISTALSVIGFDEFSSHIANYARENSSDMIVIPWNLTSTATTPATPSAEENQGIVTTSVSAGPFDGIFSQRRDDSTAFVHSQYVRKVFADSPTDVALFVDRGSSQAYDGESGHHLFLPFFGGSDDRLALSLVVQLCMNPAISATVIRMKKSTSGNDAAYNPVDSEKGPKLQTVHESRHVVSNSIFSQKFSSRLIITLPLCCRSRFQIQYMVHAIHRRDSHPLLRMISPGHGTLPPTPDLQRWQMPSLVLPSEKNPTPKRCPESSMQPHDWPRSTARRGFSLWLADRGVWQLNLPTRN